MPDPSFVLPLLLQSVLIPAAICAALLLAARSRSGWPAPVAIAGGFLASLAATYHAQWSFPPHQALDWMPLVLLGALCPVVVERHSGAAGRLLVSVLTAAIVALPALGSAGLARTLATIAVMALLMSVAWTALAASSRRAAVPLALTVAAGGAGLVLMMDASQLLGQLCGGLGMAIGVCGLLRRPFGPAAAATAVLLLGALLGYGTIYAGFGLLPVTLLVAALLADPLLGALRRRPAAALPGALLTVLPVLVAVGLAVKAMQDAGGY